MPTLKHSPVARIEQIIRAPARAAYEAFVQPALLKKFWLAKASARLEVGRAVDWHFKVRGARDRVTVLALEPDRRIRLRWSDGAETEWTFLPLGRKQVLVHVEQTGFRGTSEAKAAAVADTAQGFAFVLSDLKVLLEHGLRSGIVKDKARAIERAMRAAK